MDMERYRRMKEMRESGMTYAEIGRRHGLSGGTAIPGILAEGARREAEPPQWHDGLPVRVVNVLMGLNLHSKEDVREYFTQKDVFAGDISGLGSDGVERVYRWIGVQQPKAKASINESFVQGAVKYLTRWGYTVIPPAGK